MKPIERRTERSLMRGAEWDWRHYQFARRYPLPIKRRKWRPDWGYILGVIVVSAVLLLFGAR